MNNDFDHLLVHAEIGALFIDAKLRIRKITPIMLQATNLRLTDIGQPIGQVNFMDGYHDFDKDVEEAFFQDQVSEREVIDKNHMNWLVKMRPYKMENNKANGVLVILFDITKRLEAAKYELKLLKIGSSKLFISRSFDFPLFFEKRLKIFILFFFVIGTLLSI